MDLMSGNFILILCFIVGSALIVLEAFMPGFGVAGIAGVILEIIAIASAWMYHGTVYALVVTFLAVALVGVAIFFSYRSAMKGRLSKSPLILKETEDSQQTATDLSRWMDHRGVAVSAIRPAGTVEIEGEKINASSGGEFIPKGAKIRVVGYEGDHLVIRKEA